MEQTPIIIERTFNAPVDLVWNALTDREEMKKWYFDLAAFEPVVGFEFEFFGGKDPDQPYRHLCMVTEVVHNRKITYSWRYDGYQGISFVTFELFPEGSDTRLVLTHKGLETFPATNPDFAKHNFVDGWTHILGTSLLDYLNKLNLKS